MCQPIYRLCLVGILLVAVVSGTVGAAGTAHAQLPSTDIWLAPLQVSGGAAKRAQRGTANASSIRIGEPENVTRRIGYDNQPGFLPDNSGFLYTRGDSNGTDIYRFDIRSRKITQVTETPESEYSPTPFASRGAGFCAVRVESDSTQRLWRFNRDGSDPRLVLAPVDSVGYFAWLDDRTLALFVVGDPHTLRIVDVETERETIVAADIGRALLRTPRDSRLTFLIHQPDSDPPVYVFHTWREHGDPPAWLIDAKGSGQDAVWIGDTLVMADGATLWCSRPFDRSEWVQCADLGRYGIAGITRIAVSLNREWIALVAPESP